MTYTEKVLADLKAKNPDQPGRHRGFRRIGAGGQQRSEIPKNQLIRAVG